jgi:conjugative relaxase-like TrwC/TraI family protein
MAWMRMMGVESVAYHRETVMRRADDHPGLAVSYYASHGETPLGWGGSGAEALSLVGSVTEEQYDLVFGPGGFRDPTTGTRLVSTTRPGIELVVSAHKSVALLGVIGWTEEMHSILDAETEATLAFLDDWVRGSGGRRGRAQQRTPTEGLVYARTRHATSRAGDPEPHDHVLVANVVEMMDERGGYKALDTALIRDVLHAATMAGRLAGARRAVELGFAIRPDPGPSGKLGHWRIAGIPLRAMEVLSKRSAEIDAAVAEAGHGSYQARQVAARTTRKAKRHTPEAELMPVWRRELEDAGLGVERLAEMVMEDARNLGRPPTLSRGEVEQLVASALGPEGPLAERKVFTRADVIVAVAPALYGQHPDLLGVVVSRVVRHPEAIPLVGVAAARDQAYAPACVVAVEAAITDVVERAAARTTAPAVGFRAVERAIWGKEANLGGRPLTVGQTDAAIALATSARGAELVLGVAGAGKTAMLDVVRAAFAADGYRVVGTSTSGQAVRTLGDQANIESRTMASLLWRLNHDQIGLDARTVLIVDEAAMSDDPALLRLLVAADTAGCKTILVGDHRQLGAVGPAGAFEGLVRGHPDAVHLLRENVRQLDPAERHVLAHLRAGDVGVAVDWYADHGRLRVASTRTDALTAVVEAWYQDVSAGADAAMFAWRRANVADLNRLARARWAASGHLTGPELAVPGGRVYAAGDRIVTLAPAADGRLVTSQTGTVVAVDPTLATLELRMDDGQQVWLPAGEAGVDRLDHGYARTVHRSQGDTVDVSHRYFDGGGRELAYVSMSRARREALVYVVADDIDQAKGDLAQDWSRDRRQRWAIDTGTPATGVADVEHEPKAPTRLQAVIREARLGAERDAVASAIPAEVGTELRDASRQLAALEARRHDLETGGAAYWQTPEGRAGAAVHRLSDRFDAERRRADDPALSRSQRRSARYEVRDLTPELDDALEHWKAVCGAEHARLTAQIDRLAETVETLQERHDHHLDWLDRHPEAVRRLERLDRELDTYRPEPVQRVVGRATAREAPSRPAAPELDGPDLGLGL